MSSCECFVLPNMLSPALYIPKKNIPVSSRDAEILADSCRAKRKTFLLVCQSTAKTFYFLREARRNIFTYSHEARRNKFTFSREALWKLFESLTISCRGGAGNTHLLQAELARRDGLALLFVCHLYTSDPADETHRVDLGGRGRIK